MLVIDGLEAAYGLSQVLFGVTLARRRRPAGDAARTQRHGQDDDGARVDGARPASAPAVCASRTRRCSGLPPSSRSRQAGLGLVPEGRQVFPNLTVCENLVATAAQPLGR